MSQYKNALDAHYGRSDLIDRIYQALEKAGRDVHRLTVDNLSPIDEMHIAGRESTLQLGNLASISERSHVIDIGCGIGGPARRLAHHYGCRVTGIDITEQYCTVARWLTERTGLDDRVQIYHANALELPFDDNIFDLAWTQHTIMNIPDKRVFLKELIRVLKPGAKFAFHDILAGPRSPVHYPVPWANDETISYLCGSQQLRDYLQTAGLIVEIWEDITQPSIEFLRFVKKRAEQKGEPLLTPKVILGPRFPDMVMNLLRNLEEERLKVIRAVLLLP